MKLIDYLVMRTPQARMGGQGAAAGTVSPSRIVLSLCGLILGIALSFVVTGIQPSKTLQPQPGGAGVGSSSKPAADTQQPSPEPKVAIDLSWHRLQTIGLITLVICGLTYQGLYLSLSLYDKQPSFLILFVSFQYGFFWQSVVQGAARFT
jgi:hypothetical protein